MGKKKKKAKFANQAVLNVYNSKAAQLRTGIIEEIKTELQKSFDKLITAGLDAPAINRLTVSTNCSRGTSISANSEIEYDFGFMKAAAAAHSNRPIPQAETEIPDDKIEERLISECRNIARSIAEVLSLFLESYQNNPDNPASLKYQTAKSVRSVTLYGEASGQFQQSIQQLNDSSYMTETGRQFQALLKSRVEAKDSKYAPVDAIKANIKNIQISAQMTNCCKIVVKAACAVHYTNSIYFFWEHSFHTESFFKVFRSDRSAEENIENALTAVKAAIDAKLPDLAKGFENKTMYRISEEIPEDYKNILSSVNTVKNFISGTAPDYMHYNGICWDGDSPQLFTFAENKPHKRMPSMVDAQWEAYLAHKEKSYTLDNM